MSRLKADIETAYTPSQPDLTEPDEHEAINGSCLFDSCNESVE